MPSEWTVDTLKEHIDKLREADQNAIASALRAAELAAAKADTAVEKRFDGVNEFRAALADQAMALLPRHEYATAHSGLVDRIEALSTLVNKIDARDEGRSGISTPLMVALAGVGASALVTFALLLSGHLR